MSPDPNRTIVNCRRPHQIDADIIESFRVQLDGRSFLDAEATVPHAGRARLTSQIRLARMNPLPTDNWKLIVAYRPVTASGTDWQTSPCEWKGRGESEFEFRDDEHDRDLSLDAPIAFGNGRPIEPGVYEVRYYLVHENPSISMTPQVRWIGSGRLRLP